MFEESLVFWRASDGNVLVAAWGAGGAVEMQISTDPGSLGGAPKTNGLLTSSELPF